VVVEAGRAPVVRELAEVEIVARILVRRSLMTRSARALNVTGQPRRAAQAFWVPAVATSRATGSTGTSHPPERDDASRR